jgi:hypothetical protein
MKKISLSVCIAIVALIAIVSGAAWAEDGRQVLSSEVTMQPANSAKDPYSLQFTLNATAPGRISVLVRKPEGSIHLDKGHKLFRIIIMDERGIIEGSSKLNKKYILKQEQFGNERGLLEYSVDQVELAQIRGKYVILISNFYTKHPYQAAVFIRYPVLKLAPEQTIKPVEMKKFTVEGD